MKYARIGLVPLSGFHYRSARDEILQDVAEELVERGIILEHRVREDDGWKITYTLNPQYVTEEET